jgi:hypothetical protein
MGKSFFSNSSDIKVAASVLIWQGSSRGRPPLSPPLFSLLLSSSPLLS